MKHIKLFENYNKDIENYFKNKIDYKFLEYLQYKITDLEDVNYYVSINIQVRTGLLNYHNIASVNMYENNISLAFRATPPNNKEYAYNIEYLEDFYKKDGLFYSIFIRYNDDIYKDNREELDKLYKRLSVKCDRVELFDEDDEKYILRLKQK